MTTGHSSGTGQSPVRRPRRTLLNLLCPHSSDIVGRCLPKIIRMQSRFGVPLCGR